VVSSENIKDGYGIWNLAFGRGDECVDVEWDGLGFGLIPTDYMYVDKCRGDQKFGEGRAQLSRYGNIELSPAAGVLNYGQVILN